MGPIWPRPVADPYESSTLVASTVQSNISCGWVTLLVCFACDWQVNWDDQHIFVDAQAGRPFASSQHRTCPCITKARGGTHGFYVVSMRRWMTIHEIAGFQGMPSWVTDRFLQKGITESILGRALGDAMSLNVLMRVLPRALFVSGVLHVLPNDLWEDALSTFGKRHMPDALLGKGRRG